jgi:hypothetical protein
MDMGFGDDEAEISDCFFAVFFMPACRRSDAGGRGGTPGQS